MSNIHGVPVTCFPPKEFRDIHQRYYGMYKHGIRETSIFFILSNRKAYIKNAVNFQTPKVGIECKSTGPYIDSNRVLLGAPKMKEQEQKLRLLSYGTSRI